MKEEHRMATTYTCDKHVIEAALEKLKQDKLVSPDAEFNYAAPHNLRSEVAYRDFDFLVRLGRTAEDETVHSILSWLKQAGIVAGEATYEEATFEALRREVKENFAYPGSSITPVMERLLYLLSSLRQPRLVIGLGTYCGNALVWAVGASCGAGKTYSAEKIYGIDIDAESTACARANFNQLADADHVELLAEDALAAVERLEGLFDYVFLDVDSKELGKGLYLELLTRLYGKIVPGGWVLAHDTVVPSFTTHLEPYLAFVRNSNYFRQSISFDVDPYGLELSIK
jgi:predicted O-methyltransferase YrrM